MNGYSNLENKCRRLLDRRRKYEELRKEIHLDVLDTVRYIETARIGHSPEIIRWDVWGQTAVISASWYSPSVDKRGRVEFPLELVYNNAAMAKWKKEMEDLDSPDWEPEDESEEE